MHCAGFVLAGPPQLASCRSRCLGRATHDRDFFRSTKPECSAILVALLFLRGSLKQMRHSRLARVLAASALFLLAGMPLMGRGPMSAVDQGAQQFQANCAGCHGADGKGGDKGPSIATLPSVVALSEIELIKIVRDGTAAGMPSFQRLGDAEITEVVRYLRTLQGKTAVPDTDDLTGNAVAGRVLYFGKAQCSNCHMVNTGVGQGGFIASDLTSYGGTHTARAIKQAIVQPDTPLDPDSRVVEVQTKTGKKLIGVVRSEDNFNLALQTEDGRYHFLTRSSLAEVNYKQYSLMPRDYGTRLTNGELDDLVSFLIVTGKNAPAEAPPPRRRRHGDRTATSNQ
jgi:cytochrome c oxidase cbb3-type subunit 3